MRETQQRQEYREAAARGTHSGILDAMRRSAERADRRQDALDARNAADAARVNK